MITLKCMTMALCKLEPRLAGKWNIDTYQHVLTTNQIQLLGQWASAAKYYTLPTRGVVISIVSSISIEMTSWFRPSKPNVESSIQPHLQPSGPSGMQRGKKSTHSISKHGERIQIRSGITVKSQVFLFIVMNVVCFDCSWACQKSRDGINFWRWKKQSHRSVAGHVITPELYYREHNKYFSVQC